MPMAACIGETFGWRCAFVAIAALGAGGAVWVCAAMPDGVRPAALKLRDGARLHASGADGDRAGHRAVGRRPVHGVLVLRAVLQHVARRRRDEISLLFVWFGAFGLIGNVLLSRYIDRIGAAPRGRRSLVLMARLAAAVAARHAASRRWRSSLVPWALGCFSSNSAQQARLGIAAPALAPALMALNTLGDLPRPGRRRGERRLADRAPAATRRSAGSAWPGWSRRSRSACGRAAAPARRAA